VNREVPIFKKQLSRPANPHSSRECERFHPPRSQRTDSRRPPTKNPPDRKNIL